eukprot:1158146-Pelagomonas_calceolata.AAC.2
MAEQCAKAHKKPRQPSTDCAGKPSPCQQPGTHTSLIISTLLLFAEREVGGFVGVATFVMVARLLEAELGLFRPAKPEG